MLATPAAAQSRVILALDHGVDDARSAALRYEVALRGADLEIVPAIAGATSADREQHARLLAQERGALACVWLERDGTEVHAVTPAGPARFATLPRDVAHIDPRVLAVVTASVLDEAIAPPRREAGEPSAIRPGESTHDAHTLDVAAARASTIEPSTATLLVVVPQEEASEAPRPEVGPPTDAAVALAGRFEPTPETSSLRDGEPHFELALDATVGAVWSPGEQNNVAHALQRVTPVVRIDDLRIEVPLGFGVNHGMDGGYPSGPLFEASVYAGASIDLGLPALDLGGLVGVVAHSVVDSNTPENRWMLAARIAGVIGLVTPDDSLAFPFRARIEVGLFARADPGLAAPFTNVVLGIAFR